MWTAVVAEAVAAVLLVVQLMVIGAFAVVDLIDCVPSGGNTIPLPKTLLYSLSSSLTGSITNPT